MQNYNKLSARVLSLALSAAMVFTSFSTTVFAAEEAAPLGASGDLTADSIITAFDALGEGFEKSDDGHTYLRSVELNTPFEEVGLPTELGVTVKHPTTDTEATVTEAATTEPVATEPVVTEPTATEPEAEKKSAPEQISSLAVVREEMIPITWNGDRDYTPAEDSKVLYTAVLPEGYALADGVKLPTINVMVGKQPMAAMPRAAVVEVSNQGEFESAIANFTDDTTIKLTADISAYGDYNIHADKTHNLTLDLNGHNLTTTAKSVLQNSSPTTLTITDSSSGTAGTITAPSLYTAIWNADENGTLNIHNVTIQGSSDAEFARVIENSGTLNIYSGTIKETGAGKAIENNGTANIMGGTVQGTGASKAIENGGIVNISGGTVQAENNAALSNFGGKGKYIISGANTAITSAATGENGTICFSGVLGEGYKTDLLTITGGTISNTNPENYSVYFAADTGVTGDNLAPYYTKAEGATVGNVFPVPTAPKVSFDARNGTITGATIDEVTHTIDAAAIPAAPTWGDYTFAGWYTDVDGKGTEFKNENLTASVTAYAKWTKNGKAVRTEPLDLRTATTDLSGDGWKWDNANKKLTLDGIILNSSKLDEYDNARGILFPDAESTIILVDGTENTVDVSSAKGRITNSQPIFASNALLTIKTSGKGTPGKLNAIAGNADYPSFGIYAGGGLVIESGDITATAGESTNDNSVGISADTANIHIKGGTVKATGGISNGVSDEYDTFGSFGMYGANVQIDDGAVTATGGTATLSAGIVGAVSVKLNGGDITAKGNTAAVAAITNSVVIDDIASVTVNGIPAKVGTKNIGMDISTLLGAGDAIVKDAVVKFKPNYTGTNTLAPNAYKATKTDTSITLPTQEVAGEIVEYCIEKPDGTITWQDSNIFTSLSADTPYTFYTRVKKNDEHKAGTTSAATLIKTKKEPVSVSGAVKKSDDTALAYATVTLTPSNPVITTITDPTGKYTLPSVPEGVYNLVIKKDPVTITEIVTVAGTEISKNDIKLLDGNKNTVVVAGTDAPEVVVGGMNALLNSTNLDETLKTQDEKDAVAGGGSVDLTFKADLKPTSGDDADKSAIEGIAGDDQKIDLLLDLSVQKTVRALGGVLVKDEKISSLAGIIEVYLPIPAELQGKTNLRLYRIHNGNPELLGEGIGNANTDGEYYTIDGTFMTLRVKNFSTYALGYSAFTVTIADGGTGVSGSGKYSDGDTVTIKAGSKSGYSFDGWTVTVGTVTLANPGSANTTFTMPAEAVTVTAGWTSTGGGSGSGGGSSDDNGEYEFWMQGMDKIDTAKSGDVIKLNLKSNDKMPASVMAALRKNPGVSLVITWNGGKTITIPAGKAPKQEDGRIYYPLSMLAELYAGYTEDSVLKSTAPQNPQTGGPSSFISAAGGELITLEAPTPALTENAQANIVTSPDAGFEASAFAGTPDASAAQGTSPIAVAALVLLLAALGGGWVLLWKRDSKEQE